MYKEDFMYIKDFRKLDFPEKQIQYLILQKEKLKISEEQIKSFEHMPRYELRRFYSSCLNELPIKPTGANVTRRVSSITNAICMDYSLKHADYDIGKKIPEEVFEERDSILCFENGRCVYCNTNLANSQDHMIPSQNKGLCGLNNDLNRVPSCSVCNNHLKKSKPLHEWLVYCNENWGNHWDDEKCKKLENHVEKYKKYYYSSAKFTEKLENWKPFLSVLFEECIKKGFCDDLNPPKTKVEQQACVQEMMKSFQKPI